jgi:TPR repeat protein
LFETACKAGESNGCRFLALNLETGSGRTKSLADALINHQKACQLGDANSCKDAQRIKGATQDNNESHASAASR